MTRTAKILVTLIVMAGIILGAILGVNNARKSGEKLSIVATNFPAYDFARAVTGDTADIKMLIKPGAETHDFEPTPQDIIDIENSTMFIYTGGESDEWIEGILEDIDTDKTKLIKMMEVVDVVEEETVEGMEGEDDGPHDDNEDQNGLEKAPEYDEHVWTSLKNAIKIVDFIKDELIKISPKYEKTFSDNANYYTNRLSEIDRNFQDVAEHSARKTLVFADRFPLRYFVDEYGLDYYAAFPGCSEQTEASSKTVAFLIDTVKNNQIPAVFKIELSNGKLAESIASETGAKVLEFQSGHNISLDEFTSGVTYADLMENNLSVVKEALN